MISDLIINDQESSQSHNPSGTKTELCKFIDWRKKTPIPGKFARIYFGHETCQEILPSPEQGCRIAEFYRKNDCPLTFVTPFLTEPNLEKVITLLEKICLITKQIEVVCSDWGLLNYLSGKKSYIPIIGRFLSAQATDPRIGRIFNYQTSPPPSREVYHVDGTVCQLHHKKCSPQLIDHYCALWLDRPAISCFFKSRNISRCEISNTLQGIKLLETTEFTYSLHLPYVPVTVIRKCPDKKGDCVNAEHSHCHKTDIEWALPEYKLLLVQRDNCLYYTNPDLPKNLQSLPIDRLVISHDFKL